MLHLAGFRCSDRRPSAGLPQATMAAALLVRAGDRVLTEANDRLGSAWLGHLLAAGLVRGHARVHVRTLLASAQSRTEGVEGRAASCARSRMARAQRTRRGRWPHFKCSPAARRPPAGRSPLPSAWRARCWRRGSTACCRRPLRGELARGAPRSRRWHRRRPAQRPWRPSGASLRWGRGSSSTSSSKDRRTLHRLWSTGPASERVSWRGSCRQIDAPRAPFPARK